ncbi:stearoyl-CoA 9-desaturase [Mycobacteroides abscessus subsp. abscessus]|nr:stearoyl-CoA 9-desaturase [Mycobacteroides abscessus subsp. abscessus]
MAITDISAFAHLTSEDVENLAVELDGLRREIEESRGARDARYIRRTIAAQRALELSGRVLLAASTKRAAWWAGTLTLAVAKIIENMEIGHNVLHGQWDWMNDPEIHSSTWVLRVTRDESWKIRNLFNIPFNFMLAAGFEWGIALQHLELRKIWKKETREATKQRLRELVRSAAAQVFKDYVAFPAITAVSPGATYRSTLTANATANLLRNFWSNAVIFCGHFPDGAEKFTVTDMENETRGQWYLRQLLGSANFNAGPAMRLMSGNLCHQIEHHIYPDLPSNRLHEISVRVREICERYDLPYTTGSMLFQYAKTWRTIAKLSLPDRFLHATADNAPETRSERMFVVLEQPQVPGVDSVPRRGLKTAIAMVRERRRNKVAV